jgi:hypothetical protein
MLKAFLAQLEFKLHAKKYANGDATKELFYVDSLKEKLADKYLDSLKLNQFTI